MAEDDRSLKLVTWAALLGRWVELARAATALPDDEQGNALRESVPDVIMLQAVWMALGELSDLPRDEQLLGLDRAGVLIEQHAAKLEGRFGGGVPEAMGEMVDDARSRWAEVKARLMVES